MATLLSDPYAAFTTMDNATWNHLCQSTNNDLVTEDKITFSNISDNIVIENEDGVSTLGAAAKNNIIIGSFTPVLTNSSGNNTIIGCGCRTAVGDTNAIVLGNSAGGTGNCSKTVLLGLQAGSQAGSNYESVSIGASAGHLSTNNQNSVLVGFGVTNLPASAAVGSIVPTVTENAILIGNYAGGNWNTNVSNLCIFGNNIETTVPGDARSPHTYIFHCGYGNGYFGIDGNPESLTHNRFLQQNSAGDTVYWPDPASAFVAQAVDGISSLVLQATRVGTDIVLNWIPQDTIQTLPYMLHTTAGANALAAPVNVVFHRTGKVVTVYVPAMLTTSVTLGNLPYLAPTGTAPAAVNPIAVDLQTGNCSFFIDAAGRAGIYGAFSLESFVSTPGRINMNLWELEGNPTSAASIWKSGFLDNANGDDANPSGMMFTYVTA